LLVTVRDDMKVEVGDPVSGATPVRTPRVFNQARLLQLALLALTLAGVVIGVRIAVPGGTAPVNSVAFGLTVAWALVGFVDARARERAASKPSPFHLLAAVDAFVAMIALTAGRQAQTVHASSSARDIATVAAVFVTAISFHFLIALPDGRLHDSGAPQSRLDTWPRWVSGSC
jgi:hypothetical protein